jgi:dipeptidyl aminopeptidase/acylaminoacyl peptidase
MALDAALRSILALTVASGSARTGAGFLLADYREASAPVLLDPETGGELKPERMPAFVLSTDGEATDGNIVRQHWNMQRMDAGIMPILLNHTVRGSSAPLGVGLWREGKVETLDTGRALIARADFDRGDVEGASAEGKVRRGYLRSVSIGWIPGGRVHRGDLSKDDPAYRPAQTDECGTRVEGSVMGTEGDPNEAIEASLTPIPADPRAVGVERLARAAEQIGALSRDERVTGVDMAGVLLALRDRPAVRAWARAIVQEELSTPAGRELLRSLLADPVATEPRLLSHLFGA